MLEKGLLEVVSGERSFTLLPPVIFGGPYIVKCIGKSANSIMILVAAVPTITGPLYDQVVS